MVTGLACYECLIGEGRVAGGPMWELDGVFACRSHARAWERMPLSRGGAVIYDGDMPRESGWPAICARGG